MFNCEKRQGNRTISESRVHKSQMLNKSFKFKLKFQLIPFRGCATFWRENKNLYFCIFGCRNRSLKNWMSLFSFEFLLKFFNSVHLSPLSLPLFCLSLRSLSPRVHFLLKFSQTWDESDFKLRRLRWESSFHFYAKNHLLVDSIFYLV